MLSLTWHRWTIILAFFQKIFLCFHTPIPLDKELETNNYKTSVRSIYLLFPGGCEDASKHVLLRKSYLTITCSKSTNFFSVWVFFHNHSRITGLQRKWEGIPLTLLYRFQQFHGHLDVSRAITAGSSPLLIGSSRTRTRNLWFPSASR